MPSGFVVVEYPSWVRNIVSAPKIHRSASYWVGIWPAHQIYLARGVHHVGQHRREVVGVVSLSRTQRRRTLHSVGKVNRRGNGHFLVHLGVQTNAEVEARQVVVRNVATFFVVSCRHVVAYFLATARYVQGSVRDEARAKKIIYVVRKRLHLVRTHRGYVVGHGGAGRGQREEPVRVVCKGRVGVLRRIDFGFFQGWPPVAKKVSQVLLKTTHVVVLVAWQVCLVCKERLRYVKLRFAGFLGAIFGCYQNHTVAALVSVSYGGGQAFQHRNVLDVIGINVQKAAR